MIQVPFLFKLISGLGLLYSCVESIIVFVDPSLRDGTYFKVSVSGKSLLV